MLELLISNYAKSKSETVRVNARETKKNNYLSYENLYENIGVC
jgi:hypothetical protein